MPTPAPWRDQITAAEVQVLPLIEAGRAARSGWCSWGVDLLEVPDVEVMCGGINVKTPQHMALWRQGNLMHFGFEESPSELNATGRALLENSIVYIARFTADRPILVSPTGFVDRNIPRSRYLLRKALEDPAPPAKRLASLFDTELQGEWQKLSPDDAKAWIRANLDFLASGSNGRLVLDKDALALGIGIDAPGFFAAAMARAGEPQHSRQVLALLARRIPEGPGADATAAAWQSFLDANKDYLFFTESSGYVWRLDPLAQKRRVPTSELRGSRRAG